MARREIVQPRREGEARRYQSGCKMSLARAGKHEGKMVFNGWKKDRSGFTTFFAFPYYGTGKPKRGKNSKYEYQTYMLEITPENGASFVTPCLHDVTNSKIVCPSRNLVMKPQSVNGGYVGKQLSKSYK